MPPAIFFYDGFAIFGAKGLARIGGPASYGCVRLHSSHAAASFALVERQGRETPGSKFRIGKTRGPDFDPSIRVEHEIAPSMPHAAAIFYPSITLSFIDEISRSYRTMTAWVEIFNCVGVRHDAFAGALGPARARIPTFRYFTHAFAS
jgi:hypothetical protein